MDNVQVMQVVKKYSHLLGTKGYAPTKSTNMGKKPKSKREHLEHIRWMCDDIPRMLSRKDNERYREKCFRWLGFIQGVLYEHRFVSVTDLLSDNNPFNFEGRNDD